MIWVEVQESDFSVAEAYETLRNRRTEAGAVALFVGLVRDRNLGDEVSELELQHYPGMTEKAIESFARRAADRWPVLDIHIIHRVGRLSIQDQIVFVGVTSAHREAAFAACDFLMDFLKSRAPFWKKERCRTAHGAWQERWIEPVEKDQQALQRWDNPSAESEV